METKVEALEGNRVKITVTVEGATVADRMKKKYKEVANQYNIPGFRRGKAPRPVIDSALGKDYVRALVTDDLINETLPYAVDESGIFPVGQVELNQEADLVADKADYTYDFEVEVKPTLELTSYDAVEIEMPAEGVDDAQIDEEIDALREHYVEIVDAPANTKVKEDKYVDMKVSATDDNGNDLPSLAEESVEYGIGSGVYPAEFDEQIMGMKKGESKQFTIDTPAEATAATASVMGKTSTITFDVEILQVKKKKLPELTDD
ncbi:MAG: FKBP-type peptidyl-prolyl cis-trans isomerase, partial [Eggerthellaceae bacterium]|nr:FKBP-type peptidyl-prolyl cis-trans isomerase [Eggerthellaceae bacterium]